MSNVKYRVIVIVAVILICIYGIIGLPTSKAELIANWHKNIRLGLDLKGGSQLTLQVQLQDAFKAEADNVIQRMKEELGKANIPFAEASRNDPQTLADANSIEVDFRGVPVTQSGDFRKIENDYFSGSWILTTVNSTDYKMTMQPSYALKLKQDTLTMSINTIDKKINGYGVSEATVQERGGAGAARSENAECFPIEGGSDRQ